jgi:uncharacterized membrane protein
VTPPPDIVLFLGRFHPTLVHLPIGMILLLAVLEGLSRWRGFRSANASAGPILALAAPTSVLAALLGWLLSLGGGYESRPLQWHQWTGIATAAMCVLAAALYRLDVKKAYRFCLWLSAALLLVAGHFGGSLTHGGDYLFQYAPGPLRNWLGDSASSAPRGPIQLSDNLDVYRDVIHPVFERNCLGCHGPSKSKAGLRLDSLAGILKGGEDGPVVVPGKTGESLLVHRLHLPLSDEDHMPPEGKPQPSREEIALLEWWIEAGAPADKKVGQLNPFVLPPAVQTPTE